MKKRVLYTIMVGTILTVVTGCGQTGKGVTQTESGEQVGIYTKEATESVLNADSDRSVTPAESSDIETETERQDGERFEEIIILEGMEETVRYEHVKNKAVGFEMDYDYELFARRRESNRESFISIYDDFENPENYFELTYSPENVDTVSESVSKALSNEYNIVKESFILDRAGNCTRIDASEAKGSGLPNLLQTVYIIPVADGSLVATAHYTFENAEGFGRRFAYMMNTLAVIGRNSEGTLSDEQALSAIKSYCYISNPELESIVKAGEYPVYWDISSSDEDEIVVLFRSYTGVQIRYYIDRASGDTYVTEFVPGIIDDEQRTDESFNVRDYVE